MIELKKALNYKIDDQFPRFVECDDNCTYFVSLNESQGKSQTGRRF
jgi:hypothetical protein